MIAVIRISGQVDLNKKVKETLNRLRIRRKYACVVVHNKKEIIGMVKKVRNFVAYGNIDEETFAELIEKRGQLINRKKEKLSKEQIKKIISEIVNKEKKFEHFNLKPFFRLHPPRGGIKSKIHFPKGVLGNHGKKINDLIKRML